VKFERLKFEWAGTKSTKTILIFEWAGSKSFEQARNNTDASVPYVVIFFCRCQLCGVCSFGCFGCKISKHSSLERLVVGTAYHFMAVLAGNSLALFRQIRQRRSGEVVIVGLTPSFRVAFPPISVGPNNSPVEQRKVAYLFDLVVAVQIPGPPLPIAAHARICWSPDMLFEFAED
jgi:hypothetical protein